MNLKNHNGDGVAKTDARFNDIVGSFPNDAAEGQLSSYHEFSCPDENEIAEQFRSSENSWKNKVNEMTDTPWAEISEDPANNSFPTLRDFCRLVNDACDFTDFMPYFHECAPSIDCRNLFQAAMLLRFIFLRAHILFAEGLPVNDRHKLDSCLSEMHLPARNKKSMCSRIVHAYSVASMRMPAWVSPDSYLKND